MDDIIIIDDFLNEEELDYMLSLSNYKDDSWIPHGSCPQGNEMFDDF